MNNNEKNRDKTGIGNVFVGMIFCMSAIVFALALVLISDHQNWNKKAREFQKLVKAVEDDNSKLTELNKTLHDQITQLKAAYPPVIAKLQEQTNTLLAKNETLTKTFRASETNLQKQIEDLSSNSWTINEKRSIIQRLAQDTQDAQRLRGIYLHFLAQRVTEKNVQTSAIKDLEESNKELVNNYADAKIVLGKFGLQADPSLYPRQPRFAVNGLIDRISKENTLQIQITIGASDGIEPGHYLDAYRGNSYVGRVVVLSTEPNRAVCQILPQYRQATFLVGDVVTSKIL